MAGGGDYSGKRMYNAFDPYAKSQAERRKMLEAEEARLDFLKKIQRSDRQRQEVLRNPATEAMAAAMGARGVPGRSSSTRMSDAEMRKIIGEQSPKYGLMAGLKTGENIAKQTNRYQPSTGLRRLGEIFGGMGTTPGASFASDLIGSGQRLSARDEAGALRNRAEQAAQQKAATQAKLLEMKQASKQRAEARAIEELNLRKAADERSALPKPSAINKPNIKAMEDVIDSLGLNYENLYDSWFNFMTKDDKPNKETAKTALATTALDLQRADPSLIGKTRETLEMAIAILSGKKEKKSAAPAAGSIQNIQNLKFSK